MSDLDIDDIVDEQEVIEDLTKIDKKDKVVD